VVFAESCTAGQVSASLSAIPGISEFLCGSAVTYRNGTKAAWLGISSDLLDDPEVGPVSAIVAEQMCRGALDRTPEADIAVSVTGHLGPGAPAGFDGLIFIGTVRRSPPLLTSIKSRLTDACGPGETLRRSRQWEAVALVFSELLRLLREPST
ncbi:MAG: CinA family protein, partial [Planctomycetaceae bacterium]|nr:CinA family protein [Planctomycetaceae bacterium]